MRTSKIFSEREMESLNNRLEGKKADPQGVWHNRVKPKLIELLNWFKIKRKLEKLLK